MNEGKLIVIADVNSVGTINELIEDLMIAREKGAQTYEITKNGAHKLNISSGDIKPSLAIRCLRRASEKELLEIEKADLVTDQRAIDGKIKALSMKINSL